MVTDSTYALYFLVLHESDKDKRYHDLIQTIPASLKARVVSIVQSVKDLDELSVLSHFENVIGEIFALRIEALQWVATVSTTDVTGVLLDEISSLKQNVNNEQLADSMERSTDIIQRVISSISENEPGGIGELLKNTPERFFGEFSNSLYKTIPAILTSIGINAPTVRAFMEFVHSSLAVEFSLILAHLYKIGELKLRPEIINELSHFLFDSTQKYGAYAIVFNFWKPYDDESNEVVGCKILSQILLLEHGRNVSVNLDEILKR